ncbi:MAG: hypothetical protein ABI934_09085 [Actinomycetota bacterium]
MSTFIVIIMVLLLVVALERKGRRESPQAPGLHGSGNAEDRDWDRIKVDLQALDNGRSFAIGHHNGPRAA